MILIKNRDGKKMAVDISKIEFIEELRKNGSVKIGLNSGISFVVYDIMFDTLLDIIVKENDKVVIEVESTPT